MSKRYPPIASIIRPRKLQIPILVIVLIAICLAPTAGAAQAAAPGGTLVVSTALRLSGTTVGVGGTLTGTVTYRNPGPGAVTIRNLVIAARSGGGAHGDFTPGKGGATIPAGGTVSLTASRNFAADQAGPWFAFSSWQDSAGVWYPAPANLNVSFTVTGPAGVAPNAIYWGAYVKGVPWDLSILDTFESRAGKRSSIVHWGQPWWYGGKYEPFQTQLYERVRQRGAIPLIDWGSWDFCCGTNQPNFQLADIIAGRHDAYIRQWATDAKAWGHPFFLRLNWEMNGSWFPWSEVVNGNRSGEYVRSWQHVHNLFRQVGATNVTWVWSVNEIAGSSTPIASLYPGDGYVDWVAMDSYNWGTDRGYGWRSFAQAFDATYAALGQLAPGKPIMIAETGSSEDGGSKAAWIRDAFQVQLPTKYPKVKAVVWFNWNDNDPALDWPIESSQASIDAFRQSVGGSSYYAANAFGSIATSPIRPIGATAENGPLAATTSEQAPASPASWPLPGTLAAPVAALPVGAQRAWFGARRPRR
jgi:hypothetical protein